MSSEIFKRYGRRGVNSFVEDKSGIGRITDDTQMTLFTAEGLLRSFRRAQLKGIWGAYPHVTYDSYLRWLNTQERSNKRGNTSSHKWILDDNNLDEVRAPGTTCLTALRRGKPGEIEHPINDSKGCGGIMRVAPVGLLFWKDAQQAFKIGCELAALTHGHPSGYLTAGAFASVISLLVQGKDLLDAINESMSILQGYRSSEETIKALESAMKLYKSTAIPSTDYIHQLGGGWVAEEALSISIFCSLHYLNDYEKGVLFSIHHDGDSDSTGSITGNILGLINGISAIPSKWVANLNVAELTSIVARDLFTVAWNDSTEEWYDRYPLV